MKTENKTKTLQVRLTESDYDWLSKAAYSMGTTSSALVRQLVQMSINAVKQADAQLKKTSEEIEKNKDKPFEPLNSSVVVDEN